MKLLVENVVTSKLGKLKFIVKVIIDAIIRVGAVYQLNDNNLAVNNDDDEESLYAQLLGLPAQPAPEIVERKLLLWKTLNHVVQVGEKLHGLRDIRSLSLAKQLRVQILIQNAIMNVNRIHELIDASKSSTIISESEKNSLNRHYELLSYHRKEISCQLLKPYIQGSKSIDKCCICTNDLSFNANNPFNSTCNSCGVIHDRCCLTMNIADIDNDTILKCPLCKCIIIQSNIDSMQSFTWLSNVKNSLCPNCLVPTLII
jgi:hypothetical protein